MQAAAFLILSSLVIAQAPRGVWIDVPFVHQPANGCGSASIAMVMQYWAAKLGNPAGPETDVQHIQRDLYSASSLGILSNSMAEYFRHHGFQALAISGDWANMQLELDLGRPLIVGIKPQGESAYHYVVIVGIDSVRGLVMMNDPAQRKLLTQERADFEKEWSATHNWTLLAVPNPSAR